MLKYALLGAAMAMTVPALAQTAPAPTPAAPSSALPSDQSAPTSTEAAPAPADSAAAPAAQPAPADQVAAVVDSQFATYDKNSDGKLDEAEFGGWMVALKSQTDPATDANAPATKKWNRAAFAQADTDKSRSLTKAELTGFLSPSAAS